ncbi:protein kinase domain-containing protein [Allorhizocola rhizosphaerae]|uniref:protein kinase domain-containing protein n=1 Tax=Allorhizocola rhizosphaerae TaxID=1872709 RepID=UPI000E3D1A54|nr:protein kinase [Allorhizocola rhizosphaerae]
MTTPDNQPADGGDLTRLDPGRQRPEQERADDITELDPGRTRPAATGGPTVPEGLPAGLDVRFKITRVIRRGAASAVYEVRERATGTERVLKIYQGDPPSDEVWALLRRRDSRHLVEVFETGFEDGYPYEVMEYLPGRSLTELRESNPSGLDTADLEEIVRQVSQALRRLHSQRIAHRDIKPANIVVRSLSPFEIALVDFDLSRRVRGQTEILADSSGTTRYMPPEFMSGSMLSLTYDWWSLGMSVLELTTGRRLLEGVENDASIRVYVTSGPIGLEAVLNLRIRLLCQGLLAQNWHTRWGLSQVERWLNHEEVAAPVEIRQVDDELRETTEPFEYEGVEYRHRRPLALALTATWANAVRALYGNDSQLLERLQRWMDGLPQLPPMPQPMRHDEPADVRLLRLVRHLSPQEPPVYRGLNISWRMLPDLARDAARGEGTLPVIVRQLWSFNLLRLLETGAASADLEGGEGLADVRRRWAAQVSVWNETAQTLPDARARAMLTGPNPIAGQLLGRRRDRTWEDRMLALCLFAATANDEQREAIAQEVRAFARRARLDWYDALLRRPDGLWPAYRLRDYAQECATERDEQERAAARQRAWQHRHRTLREWSRRQNRPLALSWAVASIFAMTAICALLIGVSDLAGVAQDASIVDAWLAAILAALVGLTAEALLAWEIGGRFHPGYSILGAGLIALGRAARSIAGRGIALIVALVVLGGGYALTAYAPAVTPLAAGGGVLVWTVWRYLRWRVESRREEEEIDRAAAEQAAQAVAVAPSA